MCIFSCTIFSQEICHNCVYPQEVSSKKTPWSKISTDLSPTSHEGHYSHLAIWVCTVHATTHPIGKDFHVYGATV